MKIINFIFVVIAIATLGLWFYYVYTNDPSVKPLLGFGIGIVTTRVALKDFFEL